MGRLNVVKALVVCFIVAATFAVTSTHLVAEQLGAFAGVFQQAQVQQDTDCVEINYFIAVGRDSYGNEYYRVFNPEVGYSFEEFASYDTPIISYTTDDNSYVRDSENYTIPFEEPDIQVINNIMSALSNEDPLGYEVRFYVAPGQHFQTRFANEVTNTIGDNMPPVPTQYGYRFLRWSLTDGGPAFTDTTVVSGLTRVYAQWGHEIIFHGNPVTLTQGTNPNNATHFLPRIVPTGQSVDDAAGMMWPNDPPNRPGFTFRGWYNTAAATGGTRFFGDTQITVSVDLFARWELNPIHTITFNPYPGTLNSGQYPRRQVVQGMTVWASTRAPAYLNRLEPGNPESPIHNSDRTPDVFLSGATVEGWWTGPHGTGIRRGEHNASHGFSGFGMGADLTSDDTVFPFYVFRIIFNCNVVGVNHWHLPRRDIPFILGSGTINNDEILGRGIPAPLGNRPGYDFVGWYTTSASTGGEPFTGDTPITTSRTVWARWEPRLPSTVTFRGNGGSWTNGATYQVLNIPTEGNFLTASGVNMPAIPTRPGYFFMGWHPNEDGTGARFISNTSVLESKNLYARWVPAVTITFDQNGALFTTASHRPRHSISFPIGYTLQEIADIWRNATGSQMACIPLHFPAYRWTDPNAYGYFAPRAAISQNVEGFIGTPSTSFGIFNSRADGSGFTLDNTVRFTAGMNGITVYAIRMSRVIFHTNHSSTTDGFMVELSTYRATRSGFPIVDSEGPFPNNVTLYPTTGWSIGSGTQSIPSQAWPANWNLTGWTFMGWNTCPNGDDEWFYPDTPVAQSTMEVYAIWSPGIVFDPGMAPSGLITYGATQRYVILPDDRERVFEHSGSLDGTPVFEDIYGRPWPGSPVWPGHMFVGWNTALNRSGTTYGVGSRFTASRRLYAQWNTRLRFYGTEGRIPGRDYGDIWETDFLAVGQPVGAGAMPPIPLRNNWNFAGWNSIRAALLGEGTEYTATTIVTMTRTIYAQWSGTITFDLAGGNINGNETNPTRAVRAGQSINQTGGMPADPSRGVDTFIGWFTLNYDTMAFTPFNPNSLMENGHFTVYARFIAQYDVLVTPNLNFGAVVEGYSQLPTQQFNIINMGTAPIVITLSHGEAGGAANPNWQLVNPGPVFSQGVVLQPGDSIPAIVRPIMGLQSGTHETVFHVSAASTSNHAVSRAVDTITATLTVVSPTIVEVRSSLTNQPIPTAALTLNNVAVTGAGGEFVLPNVTLANVGDRVDASALGFVGAYLELETADIGTRIIMNLTPENRQLTIENRPNVTRSATPVQTTSGPRAVGTHIILEHGAAEGYQFMGWIRGATLPAVGDNFDEWRLANSGVNVRPEGWSFYMPAEGIAYTAIWGNRGIVGGSGYQIAFHLYTDRAELLSRFGDYVSGYTSKGIPYIQFSVVPGAPLSQEVRDLVDNIVGIYGANTPGHAFWGWFTDATLNASERVLANGFRRPWQGDICDWSYGDNHGSRGFAAIIQDENITTTQREMIFGSDGILNLYAVWARWGDVNDDDRVCDLDLTLLIDYLVNRIGPTQLNMRAANVVVDERVCDVDLARLIEYLVNRIPQNFLGRPPEPTQYIEPYTGFSVLPQGRVGLTAFASVSAVSNSNEFRFDVEDVEVAYGSEYAYVRISMTEFVDGGFGSLRFDLEYDSSILTLDTEPRLIPSQTFLNYPITMYLPGYTDQPAFVGINTRYVTVPMLSNMMWQYTTQVGRYFTNWREFNFTQPLIASEEVTVRAIAPTTFETTMGGIWGGRGSGYARIAFYRLATAQMADFYAEEFYVELRFRIAPDAPVGSYSEIRFIPVQATPLHLESPQFSQQEVGSVRIVGEDGSQDATSFSVSYSIQGDAPEYFAPSIPGSSQYAYGDNVEVASGLTTEENTHNEMLGMWRFDGWFKNGELVAGSFTMPNADVVLEGRWTFTEAEIFDITFVVGEGSEAEGTTVIQVQYGGAISIYDIPSTEAQEGWVFVEWTPSLPTGSTIVTGEMEFTANFAQLVETYYYVRYFVYEVVDGEEVGRHLQTVQLTATEISDILGRCNDDASDTSVQGEVETTEPEEEYAYPTEPDYDVTTEPTEPEDEEITEPTEPEEELPTDPTEPSDEAESDTSNSYEPEDAGLAGVGLLQVGLMGYLGLHLSDFVDFDDEFIAWQMQDNMPSFTAAELLEALLISGKIADAEAIHNITFVAPEGEIHFAPPLNRALQYKAIDLRFEPNQENPSDTEEDPIEDDCSTCEEEPTDPEEPTNATEPTEATEPAAQTQLAEATEPAVSTQPTQPAQQPVPQAEASAMESRPELIIQPSDNDDIEPYAERFRGHFVQGYADGTFRPEGNMTRAEMIQVFFNIANVSPQALTVASESRFTDVSSDAWYFEAVVYFEDRGIVQGFPDGTLRPSETITNAEFAALAVQFFSLDDMVEPDMLIEASSHWGANYINLGFARGWFEYFGVEEAFDPDAPIQRAQAVALLNFYQGRVPCTVAINAFLLSAYDNIFPDLQPGHWSFYEVIEAAFSRYYHIDGYNNEVWLVVN